MKRFLSTLLLLLFIMPTSIYAQSFPRIKQPKQEALEAAEAMVSNLFEDLKAGKSQEIAD